MSGACGGLIMMLLSRSLALCKFWERAWARVTRLPSSQSVLQAITVWGVQFRGAEAAPERSYTRSKLEQVRGG